MAPSKAGLVLGRDDRMMLRTRLVLLLFIALSLLLGGQTAFAFTFSNITETTQSAGDPATMFGTPTTNATSVTFSSLPYFTADSSGASDYDITHSLLEMDIMATGGDGIDEINIFESGQFDFTGTGTVTDTTAVVFSISGVLTVTETDLGATSQLINFTATFASPTTSVAYPGGAYWSIDDYPAGGSPYDWSGGLTIDVLGGLTSGNYATKAHLSMDNILQSNAETNSTSEIFKDFVEITVIPEPATGALLLGGVLALAALRGRRAEH